jgi:hypothetical protein
MCQPLGAAAVRCAGAVQRGCGYRCEPCAVMIMMIPGTPARSPKAPTNPRPQRSAALKPWAHRPFAADSRRLLDLLASNTPRLLREIPVILATRLLRTARQDWYEQGDCWEQMASTAVTATVRLRNLTPEPSTRCWPSWPPVARRPAARCATTRNGPAPSKTPDGDRRPVRAGRAHRRRTRRPPHPDQPPHQHRQRQTATRASYLRQAHERARKTETRADLDATRIGVICPWVLSGAAKGVVAPQPPWPEGVRVPRTPSGGRPRATNPLGRRSLPARPRN